MLKPESTIGFSKASMLSPDGRCKSFDADANGYVRAEGAGIVVLKPLSRALADSDPIYAVIRGSAVNSDGRTNGITMPSEKGQEAVLREACRQAGVLPEQVQYIEAHGTGTPVGDPIEANAIGNVVGRGRQQGSYCIIGSVKSNIGHLEPASGIAGLIKAALALKYGQIPPSLHFVTPNPQIPFDLLRLRVSPTIEPWPENVQGLRIAGVNSFGFGGTNAHVVLSDVETKYVTSRQSPSDVRALLLPLSAKSPEALQAVAKVTQEFFSASDNASVSLSDICYTATLRRSHHEERLAVVADSCDGMAENLRAFLAGETRLGMSSGCLEPEKSPKLAFVFSGMGQQWWAMGRQLLECEPVFRESIKRCDELLRQYVDWSLWDELTATEENSRINETQIAQCCIFAVQVALSALWRSWGIIPSAIVGHSVGEVAAAHVAGILSLEDAVRVIFHRSRLHASTAGRGTMLAIALKLKEAQRVLVGYEDRVSIAVINSPTGLTLSGDTQALAEIAASLEQKEIFCRFLQVEVPYHSVLMKPLKAELAKSLQGINPQPATIPLFSTVTGQQVSGPEVDAEYWGQNMRNPVVFASAVDGLMKAGYDLFLEIGAHPVLANYISECFTAANQTVTVLPSVRRKEPERAMMLGSIGRLYTLGYPVDWNLLYPEKGQFVKLPSYPWQRERYWHESSESQQARLGETFTLAMLSTPIHPLLGSQLKSAQPVWNGLIDKQQLTYLNDHRIQGVVVYPAAAYVEMALAASKEILGEEPYVLSEIEFQKALILADNEAPTLQLIVDSNQTSFDIYSTGDTEGSWVKHTTGKLTRTTDSSVPNPMMLSEYKNRCTKQISQSDVYRSFLEIGLEYSSGFQAIEQFFWGEKQALSQIRVSPTLQTQVEEYQLHPTILDPCIQILLFLGAMASGTKAGIYLPVKINSLRVYARIGMQFWCYARLLEQSATNITGDIQLLDDAGNVLVEIQGLRLQSFEEARETTPEKTDNYLYEYQWRLKARPEQELVYSSAPYLPSALEIALSVQPEADRLSKQHRRKQYYETVEPQLDALSAAYIIQALHQLGWLPQLHASVGVNSLTEQLGVAEQHRRLLGRMLEILHADGVLSKVDDQWTVCHIPQLQDTQKIWQELVVNNPSYIAELKLLGQCGPHLASVLRGEVDPLGLIFPENSLTTSEHLYQDSPTSRIYNQLTQKAISMAVASLPKERTIRILEIGAGTGSLSSYVLPLLPANRSEYVFTDISQVFTAAAEQKFSDYPFISYQILDIEKDPIAQGFSAHSFDLILASDAIHATRDLRQTLANVQQLLASSGLLVLLELTKAPRWSDLVFGLLKGWWLFSDLDLRQSHPLLCAQKWRDLLIKVGFEEVAGISDTEATQESLQTVFLATGPVIEDVEAFHQTSLSAGLNASDQSQQLGSWLIFTDSVGVGEQLATSLKERSQTPILISPGTAFLKLDEDHFQIRTEHQEDLQQVIETVSARGGTCRGIIHIWSLDTPTVEQTTVATLESAQTLGCFSVLNLVQALAKVNGKDYPRLFLVTNDTQAMTGSVKPLSIAQSPLWGFGRVLANEHPELRCTMVDLSPTISKVEIQSLFDELWSDSEEDEIALRGEARYVHRLMPVGVETLHATSLKSSQNQNPFRLEISTPGILDNLTLRATTRPKPEPHEVEIQVCATGLNFKDVALAMNLLADVNLEGNFSQRSLGLECAGVITAIGSGVEGFQIGDEVIAIATNSFGTHTTTDARLLVHKPSTISFEEAATIPVVFLTAYYALHYLGRIGKGERVLIHTATGGVGLAAIQIAKAAGAEIFATAGSPEKREFLKSLGVKYVMDSRSLAFAEQVMDLTGGKGVDIVLNSLAGEAIPKSLSVLSAYGRFLEIGKQDIDNNSNLGIGLFQKNLSFFAVDLDRLLQERPDLGSSLLRELMQHFNKGTFHPLPHRVFPISQAVSAFRYMAQAKHIGKIVVDLLDPVVKPPVSEKKMTFSESGTYLITGGLGGFGLAVAKWLVEHGARHLVLMGRSGVLSPTAHSAIEAMKQAGAEVIVAKADVTDSEQLQRVLADIPPQVPLRGIIHGAMVLDDALVVQLNKERMLKAMAPKTIGAWNLHTVTLNTPLDFFVMFSSFSSLVGNPGLGNYVPGNAFLDVLTYHRRAMGLPTLTINWGLVGDVGYAVQNPDVGERLQRVGVKPMPLQKVLNKLGELMLQKQAVQTAVVDMDWHQWSGVHATAASPRFSYLIGEVAVSLKADVYNREEDSRHSVLVSATPAQQEQLFRSRITEQVARIMGISANKLDIKRSLLQLGLDSLMAVELSHRLKSQLGVNVSTMKIMHGLSISQIAELSLEQLALESIKLSVSAAVENSEEEEEISL